MGPTIVSVQTNPDLSLLTVAGGRCLRQLNNHLRSRTVARAGYSSGKRHLRARHSAARSAVTGSVLVDKWGWLAKVSGSQGCQVTWGEHVGPRCSPGFK